MIEKLMPYFLVMGYTVCLLAIWIPAFIFASKWAQEAVDAQLFSFSYLNQIANDWNSYPPTNIKVTNATFCPDSHPDLVFSRPWYGSDMGCSCLGIPETGTGYNLEGNGNRVVNGVYCTGNQTAAGCLQLEPNHAVIMGQFRGLRICAKPAQHSFLTQVRPNWQKECPQGYQACNPDSDPDNIVCIKKVQYANSNGPSFDDRCPIVDLWILDKKYVTNWQDEVEETIQI